MKSLLSLGKEELKNELSALEEKYKEFKARDLKLDMSRGRPCREQLDLSMGMLDDRQYLTEKGVDCRNYGVVEGIPEARELFARLLEVSPDEVIVGGNSSLNLMHDTLVRAMLFGVCDGCEPWGRLPKVRFICPSPGYDRHFAICELLGIEMIVVDMKEDGPDMDAVERLCAEDEAVKGIWCVPKYSNPDGITYSDQVVWRLASMKTKAPDFRIFWDNAYFIHHLTDEEVPLKNILKACKDVGNPDRVYIFSSTSKITFPGAGIAALASSAANIKRMVKLISRQTICPDKMNQLRHVRFLKSVDNVKELMKKHAAILRPKFRLVLDTLEKELGELGIASWTKPKGGYFISFYSMDGCASRIVQLAKEAGVTLCEPGATYPYGKDPRDRNIRLAPSMPPPDELKTAMELFCLCVRMASVERLLKDN